VAAFPTRRAHDVITRQTTNIGAAVVITETGEEFIWEVGMTPSVIDNLVKEHEESEREP